MKKIFITSIIISMIFITSVFVSAATFKTGEKYSLKQGESVSGNLYVGAGDIVVSGDVTGDVVAGGGGITITGNVFGDVIAGGGSIDIFGEVGDDVRAGGGKITIAEDVGGDVLAGGGFVRVLSGVNVGGDVVVGGGVVIIDGVVNGDVRVGGGEVEINGTVLGNVYVRADKFMIGDGAVIGGNVIYSSSNQAVVGNNALISGKLVFNKIERHASKFSGAVVAKILFGFMGILLLLMLLAVLTAGIVAIQTLPKESRALVEYSLSNFWKEFLRGFIIFIIAPIFIILLLMSVVGSIIGILGGLVFMSLLIIAKVYSGIIFGGWLYKVLSKKKHIEVNWKSASLGIILLFIISLIPIIGWIICCIFTAVALGSLSYLIYKRFWLER